MKYRLAIFDLDGTLASSLDAIAECMSVSLATFGFAAPSREEVRATVGLSLEESARILSKGKASPAVIAQIVQLYQKFHEGDGAASIRLFDGTARLLENLPSYGVRSVLVSNTARKAMKQLLEHLRIWAFFDLTLSATDTEYSKPDPMLYTNSIAPNFAQIGREATLVIGDTETDITFAKAVRVDCCWAAYGYGDARRCRKLKPNYEAGSVNELGAILQGGA
jgi:phosphoglycolate phosphatase